MDLAPVLTHEPPCYLRIPIINSREEGEDCSRRNDVMEMRDHIISIVQVQVGKVEAERQTGEAADAKHGQKCQREKHGCRKADRAAPERNEQTSQNDHRWNRNDHRGGLEESA